MSSTSGPLADLRVVEFGGIGPGPFAGMVLADLGAEVLRLDRPRPERGERRHDVTLRGRPTVDVDLKHPAGAELALELCDSADLLIEGFRPGVMERLGLGPDIVLARRPQLVYGRVTGYGQHGPLADAAGHDVNYLAVAGALGAMARDGEVPLFPLNLVADYGGGAMLLLVGVLAAILEARRSGQGQVVDAAMTDGVALLTSLLHGLRAAGRWDERPGTNTLDSGAHFYEVYRAADGGHIAVGALEPKFYARLLELLEIPAQEMPQHDRARWPAFKARLAGVFAQRDAAHWAGLLEAHDTCATRVWGPFEAPAHPHMAARDAFVELEGIVQPAAAPRFARTPARARPAPHGLAGHEALRCWGLGTGTLARASAAGVVG